MSQRRSGKSDRRATLALGLCLVGLAPGCLKPLPADSATAGAESETSTSTAPGTTSTGAPTTTSATDTVTASGSTTDGGPWPTGCDDDEIYICRLDAADECGEESYCMSDEYNDCTPGECTEECEDECQHGWDCVDASSSEVLVCVRDYEEHCSILNPDCPEGTKCMPWANDGGSSWNALKCAPLDPDPVGPGEVCKAESGVSGIDNCDAQSMCWDVDHETKEGVCVARCTGTSYEDATCEPGFDCWIDQGAVLLLCIPGCDPLLQDCPGDDLCIPSGERFICVLDASGEAGLYGDPCEYANACKPGLYCLSPEYVEGCQAAGCCTPFCDTDKALMCPGATQECIPWFEEGMAPPGYENVGICGIPQ